MLAKLKYPLTVLSLCLLGGGCTLVFLPVIAPPFFAARLAPPQYPHSQLLFETEGGGNDVARQRRVYQTADDIELVLAYMEGFLPGFEQVAASTSLTYRNSMEDTSWLAEELGSGKGFRMGLIRPSVSILLTEQAEALTEIQVITCWAET